MDVTRTRTLDDGTLERSFTLDGLPGVLWLPASASGLSASGLSASGSPVPLILLGHPGDLSGMRPRLEARARSSAALGFATATIELPGKGQRPPLVDVDQARVELREAVLAGSHPSEDVIERLILPLAAQAVPEWQALIDAVLDLPEVDGPVGISGGVIAIGVRLALADPRVAAAGLFAGSYVPRVVIEEARELRIPVHVLLQWDDRGNDRQLALDLFDAFGSEEKTLLANMGGHTGVPTHAGEDAARFFVRHLG